jgi:hypothetical protein
LFCAIAAFLLACAAPSSPRSRHWEAPRSGTTQRLTVFSQVKNPISDGGRLFDAFVEIYPIAVIASLAGATAPSFKNAARRGRASTE